MSDDCFEEDLQQVLEDHMMLTAKALLQADFPSAPPSSEKHLRRMKNLISNPRSAGRSFLKSRWQKAAMFLLALGLSSLILLSFPQVRAAVRNLVRHVYDTFNRYSFSAPAEELTSLPHLTPSWLPEGYEETSYLERGNTVRIEFSDNQNNTIDLHYARATTCFALSLDTEHYHVSFIAHDNVTYEAYESTSPTHENMLVWFSGDQSLAFLLSADIPTEDLLSLAKSLSPAKK